MTFFVLILLFIFQLALQPSLYAEVQHELLAPQGDFIPEDTAFQPVRNAYKSFNFTKALQETERLNHFHQDPKIAETAGFLLGDLYLVMAERGRPLYFRKALDTYREATFRYPNSERTLPALMKMGMVYLRESLYYEALATFERILTKYPNNAHLTQARMNKGDVYLKWGKYDKAITEFDQINPGVLSKEENVFLLLNYAESYYLMDDHQTAFQYYDLISPDDPVLQASEESLYQYGVSAYESNAYTESREILFILQNKYPKGTYSLMALARIGDTLRLQGKISRAAKVYQQVHSAGDHQRNKKSASLIAAIGELHLAGCDPVTPPSQKPRCFAGRALENEAGRLALKNIETLSNFLISQIDQSSSPIGELIFEAAQALEEHKIFTTALTIRNKLLLQKISKPLKTELIDSTPLTAISAFNQLLEQDRTLEAISIYFNNKDRFPEETLKGATGLNLGIAFAKMGFYPQAVDLLSPRVINLKKEQTTENEQALFYLFLAYFGQGDHASAEKQLRVFLQQFPKSSRVSHLQLLSIEMSLQQGKINLVIKALDDWLIRYPKNPDETRALVLLGDAYEKKGDLDQALEFYLRANTKGRESAPNLYLKIANLFYKLKHYERGISFYIKTTEKSEDAAQVDWATFQLAQSYEKLGLKDKALPIYTRLEKTAARDLIKALSKEKALILEPKKNLTSQ